MAGPETPTPNRKGATGIRFEAREKRTIWVLCRVSRVSSIQCTLVAPFFLQETNYAFRVGFKGR